MHLVFILVFTLIVVAIDIYFYRAIKSTLKNFKPLIRKGFKFAYWIFSIGVLIFMIYASTYYTNQTPPPKFLRTYVMGVIFIITLSKIIGTVFLIIHDIFKLILYVIKKSFYRKVEPSNSLNKISRVEFLKKMALITSALPFGTLMYGVIKSAFDYTIHKQQLVIPNLPETFKGLKILQISDIHAGSFITNNPLNTIVDLIKGEKPDLIFFTGDLVNEISEEALPFIEVLSKIDAPLGVFSILGNHDYGDYFYASDDTEGKKHNYELMKKIHKKIGWNLLLNENHIIEKDNKRIAILGVENWGSQERFQKYGDINKAKEGCSACDVKLLLSHDPSHWEAHVIENHKDISVTFSGHTHGMQFGIEIPGFKWSPSQYMYNQWAGLYEQNSQQIYVNRGLGFIGYPGRVGILPEITVFELS